MFRAIQSSTYRFRRADFDIGYPAPCSVHTVTLGSSAVMRKAGCSPGAGPNFMEGLNFVRCGSPCCGCACAPSKEDISSRLPCEVNPLSTLISKTLLHAPTPHHASRLEIPSKIMSTSQQSVLQSACMHLLQMCYANQTPRFRGIRVALLGVKHQQCELQPSTGVSCAYSTCSLSQIPIPKTWQSQTPTPFGVLRLGQRQLNKEQKVAPDRSPIWQCSWAH